MNRRKFVKSVSAIVALSSISGVGLFIPDTEKSVKKNHQKDLQSKKKTLIVGIGGGACNAVKYMNNNGLSNVQYIIANTDISSFDKSPVQNKIQLGKKLTKGLSSGNNTEIGRLAAIENISDFNMYFNSEDIKKVLFIACLGGGTGTGALPVITKAAKNAGHITMGVVTIPFRYEGRKRIKVAQDAIAHMNIYFDSLQILNNEALRAVYGNLDIIEALGKSDQNICNIARKWL